MSDTRSLTTQSLHFPREFVDQVKDRLGSDILGIIGSRVSLSKSGNHFKGNCPFHNEASASFKVLNGRIGYHFKCFGCGATGDAISFLMRHDRLEFHEAVAYIADQVGMDLPAVTPQQRERLTRIERLRAIVALTSKWMTNQLYLPAGERALDYLHSRNVGDQEIKDFKLGYAPSAPRQWQDLIADMMSQHGFRAEELVDSGVFRGKPPAPFFTGRLMFTICDLQGRPVAFSGRVLGDGTPKYINTSECELFTKGNIVYNAHRAAEQIRQTTRPVVVVEGYMDAIRMEQKRLGPVVCCMGTAVTPAQIEVVLKINRRDVRNVPVFCLDGDKPGLAAAESAARVVLPFLTPGRGAKFAMLHDAHDPASLLEQPGGVASLETSIDAARTAPWVLYDAEARRLTEELGQIVTAEDKAALDEALETGILEKITNKHVRQAYAKEFWRRQNQRPSREKAPGSLPPLPRPMVEPALLAALLNHPGLFHEFAVDIGMLEFSVHEVDKIRRRILADLSRCSDDALTEAVARLISECPTIQDHVLTDAVAIAAPFVSRETHCDVVRQSIRDILLGIHIAGIQKDVDRLMGMLNGEDKDADQRTVAEISELLASLHT